MLPPTELVRAVMARDNLSRSEAESMVREARNEIANGADPEEILNEYFGLEPDYIFDLL